MPIRTLQISLAIGLSCIACVEGEAVDWTAEDELRGYAIEANLWPRRVIPVCFENEPDVGTDSAVVQAEVRASWERYSAIEFTEWDECTPGEAGIHIEWIDSVPHVDEFGVELDGLYAGVKLMSPCSIQVFGIGGFNGDGCLVPSSLHEFGHVLGLVHEHNRPDRPLGCDEPMGSLGDLFVGDYDPESIMNYCNPVWNNGGELSEGDKTGIQELYGDYLVEFGTVFPNSDIHNPADTCRPHFGDFDGDGTTDLLRSCDDSAFNMLWTGSRSEDDAFDWQGAVLTGSMLQNAAKTCQLHVLDFDGDGKDDLLRTCDDRVFNYIWRATGTGFDGFSAMLNGSQLSLASGACAVHVGDFDGDGRDDLLRTCDDPQENYWWAGDPSGFVGQGFVFASSVLQNSAGTVRLEVADFDGDGDDDLLRTCDDPQFNHLWHGSGAGFVSVGAVLTGNVIENAAGTCRAHLGDFNGDWATDLLRSCDDSTFNHLWWGSDAGFDDAGHVLDGNVLQTADEACTTHVADFDGDHRDDLMRTCDGQANLLWRGAWDGFANPIYPIYMTNNWSQLASSDGIRRLFAHDFDGDGNDDALRGDSWFQNTLWRGEDYTPNFRVEHAPSDLCVVGSDVPGQPAYQSLCWKGEQRRFELEEDGHGNYRLQWDANGLCLRANPKAGTGSVVDSVPCSDDPNLWWTLEDRGGGQWWIRHVASDRCLWGDGVHGAPLRASDCVFSSPSYAHELISAD